MALSCSLKFGFAGIPVAAGNGAEGIARLTPLSMFGVDKGLGVAAGVETLKTFAGRVVTAGEGAITVVFLAVVAVGGTGFAVGAGEVSQALSSKTSHHPTIKIKPRCFTTPT